MKTKGEDEQRPLEAESLLLADVAVGGRVGGASG